MLTISHVVQGTLIFTNLYVPRCSVQTRLLPTRTALGSLEHRKGQTTPANPYSNYDCPLLASGYTLLRKMNLRLEKFMCAGSSQDEKI